MTILECLGLDLLERDDDLRISFNQYAMQKGRAIRGYSDLPYLNAWFGNVQVILHTVWTGEGRLQTGAVDYHATGNAVWTMRVVSGSFNPPDYEETDRRVMVSLPDGSGLAVVDLLNADVLPGWGEGEVIRAQVVAYPEEIHYYASEEDYRRDQPEGALLMDDGMVYPVMMLENHRVEDPENPGPTVENDWSDGLMIIKGTVKQIRWGNFSFDGEEGESMQAFLRVTIDTRMGELELVHSPGQIPEAEREAFRVGATVYGLFVVCGDAAIYEYENGIVLDEENDLHLLKCVLDGSSSAERLRPVLTENSVYISEHSGNMSFTGPEEIVARFNEIRSLNPGKRYFAYLATISEVDETEDPLPYQVGKRCVILAEGEREAYQSISFIETDDKGRIEKLTISKGRGYRFILDDPPEE